ncbi:MAG: hypothetical protein JJD92_04340 [Frankiaceae bacterium]|nr:hypothetical protein [Frankiaceae bacterium]
MSVTSTALKRFGVPALAAITIFSGIPAFVGTASAAAGDTITMTPAADSASAGTCNPFTVTTKNSAGGVATGTVDVVIRQRNNGLATAADTFDVNFCAANTTTPNQMPTATAFTGTPTGTAPGENSDSDTRRGEFQPDPVTGVFTFGVIGTEAGVADIDAFIDNNSNNAIDTGEAKATSVKTFTAGTAADVKTITATPKTATNFVGETHTILATLKNGATPADTVAGITPTADITTGPNNAVTPTCGASNNDGVSTCTYIGTLVGTDSIVVFLNQVNADANPATPDTTGPDAGEPQDTVQKTWATAPTGLTIDTTCGAATTPRSGPEDCFNPLSDNNETFSALVKKADGSVAAGALVTFAITNNNPATNTTTNQVATLSATETTTDASGIATVTLTNPQTIANEEITVTATVRGQTPVTADDARKTWRTTTTGQRNIVLTPETATTSTGTFRTFSAKVTNVNGEAVQGVTVTFDESGAGAFRNGNSQTIATTDINGVATVDVTAGANESGTQTITATIGGAECVKLAGDPAGSTAGNCTDTSTNTFVVGTPSPTATGGRAALTLTVLTPTIPAGSTGQLRATGAANELYELRCYTRPSTTYFTARSGAFDTAGNPVTFTLSLGRNTRCFIQYATTPAQGASGSVVINVTTVLSLSTVRTGVRTYIFQGRNLPRVAGQLITLYRVDAAGNEIRTPNLVTDSSGIYRVTRTFTGTGTFGFKVRTSQTMNNAAGVSSTITVRVY